MIDYNKVANFVAGFEGCSSSVRGSNTLLTEDQTNAINTVVYPYNDGFGNWTQGYGSTYDLHGNKITENSAPITSGEAKVWLAHTAKEYLRQLFTQHFGTDTTENEAKGVQALNNLSQQQANALGSLVYNVGVQGILNSQTFAQLLAGNYGTYEDYNSAVGTMAYNWASDAQGFNKVNGSFNQSLENRRVAEINMYFNGQ